MFSKLKYQNIAKCVIYTNYWVVRVFINYDKYSYSIMFYEECWYFSLNLTQKYIASHQGTEELFIWQGRIAVTTKIFFLLTKLFYLTLEDLGKFTIIKFFYA